MFKDLFNYTYERNFEEAVLFYFFYIIFGYYIAGFVYSIVKINPVLHSFYCLIMLFIPFVFYSYVGINIHTQKKLKDEGSMQLLVSTILINLIMPMIMLPVTLVMSFIMPSAIMCSSLIGLFIELTVGCIPVTILTTKEDYSLTQVVYQMEKEKLFKSKRIEKQLLLERILSQKNREIEEEIIEL